MMEIICCPVCGNTKLDEGERVYHQKYEPVTENGVLRNQAYVVYIETHRCSECGRLSRSGSSTRIDDDLIHARQGRS